VSKEFVVGARIAVTPQRRRLLLNTVGIGNFSAEPSPCPSGSQSLNNKRRCSCKVLCIRRPWCIAHHTNMWQLL